MRDFIKDGDIVSVRFNGVQSTLCHAARVLHRPVATGDSWIFEDLRTLEIHYISEGCTITKGTDAPERANKL